MMCTNHFISKTPQWISLATQEGESCGRLREIIAWLETILAVLCHTILGYG